MPVPISSSLSGTDSNHTTFRLDNAAPLRPDEGSGPIFVLPGGIAYTHFVYGDQ